MNCDQTSFAMTAQEQAQALLQTLVDAVANARPTETRTWDNRGLGRIETFDGTESKWKSWSFHLEAYAHALSSTMESDMRAADEASAEPTLLGMPDDKKRISGDLYRLIVPLLKDRAESLAMNAERNNGPQWVSFVAKAQTRI